MAVTKRSVTYFILQANTRKCISQKTNAVKMTGDGLEQNECEWSGKAEMRTRKKFLAVGKACMAIL